jgi:ribonuclease R
VRYARTAWLEFDAEGMRTSTTLRRSAIRSAHRFNYEDVDELLAEPERWKEKTPAGVVELVLRMRELAMLLRGRRRRRGALELVLSEVKVVLDARGRVEGARREINTVSHQIIEEFMLAANEAVAERLHERGRLFLRRIHDPPDPRRLELLGTFVAELGLATGDLRSRHELQALLERTIDRPEAPAVHYAVLRSMSQAVYSPAQGGHYALASECYCHFTSPIRRYPDLTVHRLVDELIEGIKPGQDEAALVALGEHCSLREREAAEAERELVKLKLLHHFGSRLGETFTARITGVEEFGVFVQGLDLPIDGLVPVEGLPDDVYWFDRHTHTLAGRRAVNRFRLGDALVVAVARVDLERRKLECRWAGRVVDPTSTDPGTTAEAGEGSDAAGAASPRTLESEAGANRHSRRKRAFGGTTARAGRGKSKRPHGPTGPRGGGGAGGGRGKRRKKR